MTQTTDAGHTLTPQSRRRGFLAMWNMHPAVPTGDQLTLGEKAADRMRNGMGSWIFVAVFIAVRRCTTGSRTWPPPTGVSWSRTMRFCGDSPPRSPARHLDLGAPFTFLCAARGVTFGGRAQSPVPPP